MTSVSDLIQPKVMDEPKIKQVNFRFAVWRLTWAQLFEDWLSENLNLNCYLFTTKGGFAVKLWPNKVITYKFLFLKP